MWQRCEEVCVRRCVCRRRRGFPPRARASASPPRLPLLRRGRRVCGRASLPVKPPQRPNRQWRAVACCVGCMGYIVTAPSGATVHDEARRRGLLVIGAARMRMWLICRGRRYWGAWGRPRRSCRCHAHSWPRTGPEVNIVLVALCFRSPLLRRGPLVAFLKGGKQRRILCC